MVRSLHVGDMQEALVEQDKKECGPHCGPGLGCGHGCAWPQVAESIRDWLVANGVDWDKTVMWPEILIADDDQTFQVEQLHHDQHGRSELVRGPGGGDVLTTLKTYRQRIPIDPELLAAYLYSRSRALARQLLERHPPAVSLNGGETLIFATRHRPSRDISAEVQRVLQEALPGVNVVFAGGVDTILAGPGPVSL